MSATEQNATSLDFLQGIEPETPEQEQVAETALSPIGLLLGLSWKAIADASKLDTLSAGPPLAVIIHVPSEAWIDPVYDVVHQNAASTMIIDGKSGRKDWRSQEALTLDALDRGRSVIGIAADPDSQLPPLLRSAADLVLTLPAPTPELVREAIRAHTGRVRMPALSAMDMAGLDLHDLAAALRPESTPKACVERLKAASVTRSVRTSHDSTPLLHDLCGYGSARDWALEMLTEIAPLRSGHKPALESGLFFGSPGTGKTTTARSMAKTARLLAAARVSFGMTDSLVYRAGPEQALDMVARDRSLADAIGHALTRLMISTKRIVAEHSSVIARVADALLERSVLDGAELTALIVSKPMPARRREPRLDRRGCRPPQ